LSGVPIKEIVKGSWAVIFAVDVFGRAAQLAYYFFLALFPFLICIISSLSVFGFADRGRAVLFAIFARFLPPAAFQLIVRNFSEIIGTKGPLKMSFGVIFSFWSASLGQKAVMDTLNAAYKVRETRSFIRRYLVAIGLTCSMALLLIISLVTVVIGDAIVTALSLGHTFALVLNMAEWPLALALLLLAFAIAFYFAPNLTNPQWHWVTPGAIAGVCLLMIVSFGLRIYLQYSGAYTVVYGSLGAVIILLLCFYLIGVAVLSGGALNAFLETLDTTPATFGGRGAQRHTTLLKKADW